MLRRVVARQDVVGQRGETGEVWILFEQDDAGAGHDGAAALVTVDRAGDELQQRRLAGAVAADQRQPITRPDIEIEVAEQPAGALNEAKVFVRENRGSHGGGR